MQNVLVHIIYRHQRYNTPCPFNQFRDLNSLPALNCINRRGVGVAPPHIILIASPLNMHLLISPKSATKTAYAAFAVSAAPTPRGSIRPSAWVCVCGWQS